MQMVKWCAPARDVVGTFGGSALVNLRTISDNYAAQRLVNSRGNPKLNDAILRS
jgi:hypothetical protein